MTEENRTVSPAGSTAAGAGTTGREDVSTGELITRLSQQSTDLIRNELKLAQAEMTEKVKHAGIGAGLFGGAGVVALYGVGALIATLILVLALLVPSWLAALIVTVLLFAVAGVLALIGKKQVTEATPLAPEMAVEGVKEDIATVKGQRSS